MLCGAKGNREVLLAVRSLGSADLGLDPGGVVDHADSRNVVDRQEVKPLLVELYACRDGFATLIARLVGGEDADRRASKIDAALELREGNVLDSEHFGDGSQVRGHERRTGLKKRQLEVRLVGGVEKI